MPGRRHSRCARLRRNGVRGGGRGSGCLGGRGSRGSRGRRDGGPGRGRRRRCRSGCLLLRGRRARKLGSTRYCWLFSRLRDGRSGGPSGGAPRAAARRGQPAGGATGGRRRPRGGENAGTCALAEANRPGMRQIAGKRQYRGPGDPTRNRPSSAFGFRPFGRLRTGFRLSERPRGPSHEPGRPAPTARARCRRRARLGGRRFLAPGGSGVRLRRAMRVRLQVASAALAPTLRAAGGRA